MTNNMYNFCETFNPLAGACQHQCKYCYVEVMKKRYEAHRNKYSGKPRLDDNAMKVNLYSKKYKGKTIFVCSCNDLFAYNVDALDIIDVLEKCKEYPDNTYFFQTKNPERLRNFQDMYKAFPENSIFCTTIETNRYNELSKAPTPAQRANDFGWVIGEKHVTIEPICDFDLDELTALISIASPNQVNIGADSKSHYLPEPSKEKTFALIKELSKFTTVHLKENINRIIK